MAGAYGSTVRRKNCSCRSERRIFLYSVKNVCTEGRNLSEKMDDRDCSGSNLYGKKLCYLKYYVWSGICRLSILPVRSAPAGGETAADHEPCCRPEVIVTKEENLEKIKKCLDAIAGDVPKTTILLAEKCLDEATIDQSLLRQIRTEHTDRKPLYINFTSGSTGLPKGVAVSHRAVMDFIRIYADTFAITKEDIIGNQAPFDFDVSVKDIYTGLLTGAESTDHSERIFQ